MAVLYANALLVGRCMNPNCRNVHIDLLVEGEVVCCAGIPVEKMDEFIEDLRENARLLKEEKRREPLQ